MEKYIWSVKSITNSTVGGSFVPNMREENENMANFKEIYFFSIQKNVILL